MGTRGVCSLAVGPLPCLFAVLLLGIVRGSVAECDLQPCWNLFQSAQESLGVRDDFSSRNELLTSEETRAKCVSLRTFYLCIGNMSKGISICRGNLNFHSAQKGAERQMKQFNCSTTGPVFTASQSPRPPLQPSYSSVCAYHGRGEHRHCGLFGDPHLRTFSDDFQTCRVAGAWPLLDNKYLTVQVTNDPVGLLEGAVTATATSKVTIVIKQHQECASHRFVTYQAQADYLPSTFDDGRVHLGPDKSVHISEVDSGRHIEIYMRYIDTTLIVRLVGRYLTFAIKMPEDIVAESLADYPESIQLCAKGCPRAERINYKEFLAQKHSRLKNLVATQEEVAMSRDQAEEKCRNAKVVDFYFDSCVFDLMTTGDRNFSLAAYHALQDVLRLYPLAAEKHKNRTDLTEIDKQYGSGACGLSSMRIWDHSRTPCHRTTQYCLLALWTLLITNWVSSRAVL